MIKRIQWDGVILSLAYILLGVILILFPNTTPRTLLYIGGGASVILGVGTMIAYFLRTQELNFSRNGIVIGLILIMLGLFLIYRTDLVIVLVPYLLSFVVLISGFHKLQDAIDLRRMELKHWWWLLILALLNIILGIVLLLNPFSQETVLYIVIGVSLIFSGLTDLILTIILATKWNRYQNGIPATGKAPDSPSPVTPVIEVEPEDLRIPEEAN